MQRIAELLLRFKEYATALLLIIISLILISNSSNTRLRSFRTISVGIIASVQSALSWVPNPYALRSENHALRELNRDYSLELMRLREAALKGEKYRAMLEFKQTSPMKLLPAEVLGKSTIQLKNYATLNVGEREAVKIGMPVMTERGLVGRVIGISEHRSIVEMLLNRDTRVTARTLTQRIEGMITWNGGSSLLLKNIASVQPVKVGDTVVTSSLSPFYPENIVIGTITKMEEEGGTLFYKITVEPAVNFATLEEAYVVLHSPDEERIALEQKVIAPRQEGTLEGAKE
jgi:rod shape-determining protein MreC